MTTVTKGKSGTIAPGGAGVVMHGVGTLHLVAPQMKMETPNIELTTVNHRHLIRAVPGGAFLCIAIVFVLGLVRQRPSSFALL